MSQEIPVGEVIFAPTFAKRFQVATTGFNQSNGGAAALAYAEATFMGKPYVFGGNYPPLGTSNGTDCSGLVQNAYNHVGVTLPRTTETQYLLYQVPNTSLFRPGDCLYFTGAPSDPPPGHVGLYVGVGSISPDQHAFIAQPRGELVIFNAPFTGDPFGIRYDYAPGLGPILYATRPALGLPVVPLPPKPPILEGTLFYIITNPHNGGHCLLHGDRWAGIPNPDANGALVAQGIKPLSTALTVAQFDTLVQVPWGQA